MRADQTDDQGLAAGREADTDALAVRVVAPALDEPRLHGAVHEADRAVMLDLQAFGELGDGRRPVRESADEEKKLVLVR